MIEALQNAVKVFLEYDTPKIVHIRSHKVGLMNRLIQIVIITYVIVWVIVLNKGYQEFSTINSSIATKVKGVVKTNFSSDELDTATPKVYNRIWDVSEYVIPPQENGAFFVLTNAIITPNQTQGVCAEALVDGANCTTNASICVAGEQVPNGNGIFTGRCISYPYDPDVQTCEVYAWCPTEKDELPLKDRPLLPGSENFTVLIKNSIEFPLWNAKTRNVLDSSNHTYLTKCTYDAVTDPSCPIFRLATMTDLAGENFTELAITGGVMAIIIHWDCNLDFSIKRCIPKYTFRRLDDRDAKIAKGWNFRFSKYFDGEQSRNLYKAYGILFVVLVEGRGGKFSTIPLIMNVGSGLALLSIAVIICDIIVLYVLKKGVFYKEKKYLTVNESDGETQQSAESPETTRKRTKVGKYETFPDESDA